MAKLVETNYAICLEASIEFILSEEGSPSTHIGQKGILFTYISQRKYPGMHFIVFKSENGTIQTSPGKLTIGGKNLTIITQQRNTFAFRIL